VYGTMEMVSCHVRNIFLNITNYMMAWFKIRKENGKVLCSTKQHTMAYCGVWYSASQWWHC
jgi:hypothetical protein